MMNYEVGSVLVSHMPSLEEEVQHIKERNRRVEADKAWETSWIRKLVILILTYLVIVIFFFFAGLSRPFVNAVVPSVAFVLSQMTIPLFKKWWLKRVYRR